MRYPLKFLQRAGLVSTLLIGGVMGGLMVPLHSEASGISLTLSVDTTDPVSILSSTTSNCTTGAGSETAAGYTSCYSIRTDGTPYAGTNAAGVRREYKILNGSATASARLLVSDNKGRDLFQLVSVKIVPVVPNWAPSTNPNSLAENTDEMHTLTIVMQNKFDDLINSANATGQTGFGKYLYQVRIGGEIVVGPPAPSPPNPLKNPCYTGAVTTRALCNGVRDNVQVSAKGIFDSTGEQTILSPADNNKCFTDKAPLCPTTIPNPNPDTRLNNSISPLSFTVNGPPASQVLSWNGLSNSTLGQIDVYPQFNCAGNSTKGEDPTRCIPLITQTLKATLYGPDGLTVVSGNTWRCQNCILSPEDKTRLTNQNLKLKVISRGLKILDAIIKRPTPKLWQLIANIDAHLAVSTAPPSQPDCEGSVAVNTDTLMEAANEEMTFQADLADPLEPAPFYTGTIVTNVKPFDGHCCVAPFDAPAGSVVKFRGEGCNPCFDVTLTSPGTGSQTSAVRIDSNFTPLLISSSLFPAHEVPWEVETISCTSALGRLNTNPVPIEGATNITFDGIEADGEDIHGPVHVSSMAVVDGVGDTLTCTWRVLTADD